MQKRNNIIVALHGKNGIGETDNEMSETYRKVMSLWHLILELAMEKLTL